VRLLVMLVVLLLAFVAIGVRLAWVQGATARSFAAIGVSQRTHVVSLPAERGSIFDRNGNELAISVPQTTVWADPQQVEDPAATARALSGPLGIDVATLQDRLTGASHFSYVARRIDDQTAASVKNLKLKGIFFITEPKRFSPDGTLAAPLLGSVGTDNEGLSGLEVGYNSLLAGGPGRMVVEQDPSGRGIPGGEHQIKPSSPGSDLVLTIDRSLQYETEQDLSAEIVKANARGGMAAVMDTHTGEILAMASLVAGTTPGSAPQPAPTNEVVTRVYEPGSVNKLVTWSAALEEGLVHPTDVFAVPDSVKVADKTFHDDTSHPTYNWSVTDILTASSNVGTINVAQKLGKAKLDNYLRRYGFGAGTGLHFPGESPGILLDPAHWYPTSIATVPIGQGVAVTALQILAAYNTVANGGVYVAPKLVKAVVGPSGRTMATPASTTRRVVSPGTAREMRAMLSEVVRTGTATAAAIDGYTVSGKTGTARKTVEGVLGYKPGAYISSFAGLVPTEQPAFTALVVLDEPTPIFGGLVAAPVFAQVARYALRELEIPPAAPEPGLFDGVPHAVGSASTVVGDPGGAPPAGAAPVVAAPATAASLAPPGTGAAAAPGTPPGTGPAASPSAPTRAGPAASTGAPASRAPVSPPTSPPTTVLTSRPSARTVPGSPAPPTTLKATPAPPPSAPQGHASSP